MKTISKFFISFITFLGVFGAMLSIAQVQMNYDANVEAAQSLMGIDFDDEEKDSAYDILDGIEKVMTGQAYNPKDVLANVKKAKAKAADQRRAVLVTSVMNDKQKFLMGKANSFNPTSKDLYKNNQLAFGPDGYLYYRKVYTTIAGITDIIQSADTIGTGYSNLLQNGKVPDEQNYAIDFVALGYSDYDSASSNMFATNFSSGSQKANLCGAELEIVVNGLVEISIPVTRMIESRIVRGTVSQGANPSSVMLGINLDKPIFIAGGSKLQFNIKMPASISVTNSSTNRTALDVTLIGSATKVRANA